MTNEQVHDLDPLAVPPLRIRLGEKEYKLDFTVGVMIRASRAQQDGGNSDWALTEAVLAEAGVPPEVFATLGVKQVLELTRLITEHFLPGEAEAAAGPASSTGPLPSPPSDGSAPEESG